MASLLSVIFSWLFKKLPVTRTQKDGLPLPSVCHLVLSADDIRGKDVFVVGDVHGCYDELIQLLTTANALTNPNILVLFVGDLVSKGPKSKAVVNLIRENFPRFYSVRGNNEEMVLREYAKLKNNSSYELTTKNSWIRTLKEEDIAFLSDLPYTIEIPSLETIIVHAGLVPGKTLESQILYDMTNMRNLISEDYFHGKGLYASNKVIQGEAWASLWNGPEHVYFGHDARRNLQIYPFATGLDTGCVYGRKLTGMYLTGKKNMFSVNSKYNCLLVDD